MFKLAIFILCLSFDIIFCIKQKSMHLVNIFPTEPSLVQNVLEKCNVSDIGKHMCQLEELRMKNKIDKPCKSLCILKEFDMYRNDWIDQDGIIVRLRKLGWTKKYINYTIDMMEDCITHMDTVDTKNEEEKCDLMTKYLQCYTRHSMSAGFLDIIPDCPYSNYLNTDILYPPGEEFWEIELTDEPPQE